MSRKFTVAETVSVITDYMVDNLPDNWNSMYKEEQADWLRNNGTFISSMEELCDYPDVDEVEE